MGGVWQQRPLALCWSEWRVGGGVWGVSGSKGRSLCAGVSAGWVGEMGVWGVSGSNGRSLCAGVSAGWVGECGGSLAAMAAHSVLE